jgi:DNA-binding protein H-NS
MKTYMAVKSEIAKLEKQAADLRKREIKGVVSQIRKAIVEYGLTAADLGFGTTARASGKVARKAAGKVRRARKSVGVAKYQDPATGQTWTGHGRPPTWIVSAKSRDEFLIDAAAAKPAAPARKKRAAKKAAAAA